MSDFAPLNNMAALIAEDIGPIEAMIQEQRRKEEEEKKKKQLEAAKAAAEAARQQQAQAQMQAQPQQAPQPQAPPQDPMAAVNQQLATQNPTPADMRQQYTREAWGMKPGQEKPTFGQRTSTLLAEMVRGMAQGPKYKNIQERVQEQVEKDYQLETMRMGQLNSAERINALTQKAQELQQQRAVEFQQKMQLEQQKVANRQVVDQIKLLQNDRNLTEKERAAKQRESLALQKIEITPEVYAASEAGVIKNIVENDGVKEVTYDLSDENKRKRFLTALEEYSATKRTKQEDRTIEGLVPMKMDSVDEFGRKVSQIVQVPKVTKVTYGNSKIPSGTAPASVPDVPAPKTSPTSDPDHPLNKALTLNAIKAEYPTFTPDEHKALAGTRRAAVDINRSLSAATREFRDWAKSGRKNDAGLGEFMQGTEVGGFDVTRWAKASDLGRWAQRTFSPGSDINEQRKQLRLDTLMKSYKKAQAAAMFADGGKTLTPTEKQMTKDYWAEPTEGPIAFYRGLLTTHAMTKLSEERLIRRITPTQEQDISDDIDKYVMEKVLKFAESPNKVSEDDLNAEKFIPKLLARKGAVSPPTSNIPRPPTLKEEVKPQSTKSVREFDRLLQEEKEKKGWQTRGGATIKRMN